MVNSSGDDFDTMVDNQPIVLPEKGQQMRENTPWCGGNPGSGDRTAASVASDENGGFISRSVGME